MEKGLSEILFEKTRRNRIPFAAHLEVIHRCNLNCAHCFHTGCRNESSGELGTGEIKELMDSLKQAGTMFLIITGGEPFLREDINELLLYASKTPFSLMVFTNGTLVDEKKADFIASLNVFAVHISLYSARKEIHDKITGKPGSFEKTIQAVKLLNKKGVNTVIKCPLMKENVNQTDELRAWARAEKITLKIDPLISPCYEKNCARIVSRRLDLSSMSEMLFESGLFDIRDFKPRTRLECGAGSNMVAVDSEGTVFPCIAWRSPAGRIGEEGFNAIWNKMEPDYRAIKECADCDLFSFCGVCPGVAEVEGKEIFCEMARRLKNRPEICDQSHGTNPQNVL